MQPKETLNFGRYFLSIFNKSPVSLTSNSPVVHLKGILGNNALLETLKHVNVDYAFCGDGNANNARITFGPDIEMTEVFDHVSPISNNYIRNASCFSLDGNVEGDVLWFFAEFENMASPSKAYTLIDQVELIQDDFTAGEDVFNAQCSQQIMLGGTDFCMLSDVEIEYTWKVLGTNDPLLTYSVVTDILGEKTITVSGGSTSEIPMLNVYPNQTTTYVLERSVVNNGGISDLDLCVYSDEVTIHVDNPINAAFSTQVCGLEVTFTANGTDLPQTWDFGDGNTGQGLAVTHTYSVAGDYTVIHSVGSGCVQTSSTVVTVPVSCEGCPPAEITFEANVQNCELTFQISGLRQSDTYVIDYGYNNDSGTDLSYDYPINGQYTATLSVYNECDEIIAEVPAAFLVVDCFICDDCDAENTIGTPATETTLSQAIAAGDLPSGTFAANLIKCIEGVLRLESGNAYTFTNCTFKMAPGAEIIIEEGAQLILDGTTLFACTNIWRGITVETGGKLNLNESLIKDAQYAIYAYPATSPNEPVTDLKLTHNTLENNFVGIFVPEGSLGKMKVDLLRNSIIGTEDLKPPFSGQTSEPEGLPNQNTRPLAGMYIHDLGVFSSYTTFFSGLTSGAVLVRSNSIFSVNEFNDLPENNTYYPGYPFQGEAIRSQSNGSNKVIVYDSEFSGCKAGVIANFTSLEATGNNMDNVQYGIWASLANAGGIQIGGKEPQDGNSILNSEIAVFVVQADPSGQVDISNNTISTNGSTSGAGIALWGNRATAALENNQITVQNGGSGIFLLASSKVNLYENEVTLSSPSQNLGGILLEGVQSSYLYGNSVTGTGTGGSSNIGLKVTSSPGIVYCCNALNSTRIGALFDGACSTENNFRGTIFNTHDVGLLLTSNAILEGQVHTENQWMGSYGSGSGAVYQVSENQAQEKQFIADANQNQYFFPPNPAPGAWFDDQQNGGQQNVCDYSSCVHGLFNPDSPSTKKIALGQIQTLQYTTPILWELQRYLFRELAGRTIQDQDVLSFKDNSASGTIGAFYDVDQAIDTLFEFVDSTTVLALTVNLDSSGIKMKEISVIDSLLQFAQGASAAQLRQEKSKLADEAFTFAESAGEGALSLLTSRMGTAAEVKDQNSGILVSSVYEQNEKSVNKVFLAYWTAGLDSLDQNELDSLEIIANQCPLAGGNAVYKARAILGAAIGQVVVYDDEQNCYGSAKQVSANIKKPVLAESLQVVPNPSKEEVTVSWTAASELKGMLVITDLNGKAWLTKSLTPGERTVTLSVNNFPPGIYLTSVKLNGNRPLIVKLVIIR
ncbi:MAG TPA: PKD domain-containing protein [Flavilitoribacter sp.]|nr:PKD domain-containing protein [Flavilitoribacter sp.]